MANKILVLLILFFATRLNVSGQASTAPIVLNHFLVVVDSMTYQEILKSEIITSQFAYSHEKKLAGYYGIYIIGQDNYIEIFNPHSIENEYHNPEESWICYTSMNANYLTELNTIKDNDFDFSSDDDADYLSMYFQDSSNLISTWEMKKSHYENWAKKSYHDSVSFLSVDYNSPAESDSSRNYLFNNILGIDVLVNIADSMIFTDYMKLMGYNQTEGIGNKMRFSNSVDFIEVVFLSDVKIPTITTVHMVLKNESKSKRIEIGKSILNIEGNKATWEFKLE